MLCVYVAVYCSRNSRNSAGECAGAVIIRCEWIESEDESLQVFQKLYVLEA